MVSARFGPLELHFLGLWFHYQKAVVKGAVPDCWNYPERVLSKDFRC